ncbi:hypothetical protein ABTX71_34765 [Streptomyces parvulus]|uniref:hypothetical protein n=1 Tax=Streptomyces parvulus TaxID=146923 RepID=UPI003333C160
MQMHPSDERLHEVQAASERFFGPARTGRAWDWVLREYWRKRVFVDVETRRVAEWPDLAASGPRRVTGPAWPIHPDEHRPPRDGTAPRVDLGKLARKVTPLTHRLLAHRGADGYPIVVPVEIVGHDATGFRLLAAPDLIPPGARRAGLLAHAYRRQNIGLGMTTLTGWLTAGSGIEARYAPQTSTSLAAPPNRTLQALASGLMAKHGVWRAGRDGTHDRLHKLAQQQGQRKA